MEDLHKIWPHRWLIPKAKPVDSHIDKLGVLAVQDIEKGEVVGVLGGVIVPKNDIGNYRKKISHVGVQIDDNFFIVPTTKDELKDNCVFNHSCDPNCGFSTSITLIAIRDIKEGEELTFDYAFCETFMEDFECNCGSQNCRKVIKQTDWKIPEIQQKYKKYYSPYLKSKL